MRKNRLKLHLAIVIIRGVAFSLLLPAYAAAVFSSLPSSAIKQCRRFKYILPRVNC